MESNYFESDAMMRAFIQQNMNPVEELLIIVVYRKQHFGSKYRHTTNSQLLEYRYAQELSPEDREY